MSDKPRFWEESYVPANEAPADPAVTKFKKDAQVKPGGISAIDPETGKWKPKRLIEEVELGGHQFRWMEGPIAEARVHDEQGNHLGSVMVPFDPAEGEPGDDDLADAMQVWNSLEYIRGIVRQDAIDGMVSDLIKHKVEGDQSVSEIMVSAIAEIITESARFTVTDDEGDLTPEQLEALQVEANRVFAETVPAFVKEIANIPNPDAGGLNFWQQMAQDTIAHALMYARDAAAEEYGGLEAAAALEGTEGDAFENRVNELYKTGPFLMGSYMTAWRGWMPMLGEMVRAGIEYASEKPADDPDSLGARILKKARENLGLPPVDDNSAVVIESDNTPTPVFQKALPIAMNRAYRDGIAYTPTPQPWIHLVESLWEPWQVEADTWPERYFPLNRGQGGVRFTFQENPNGATETQLAHAREMAQNLNPVIPRVVTALGNLYTPNRKHRGRMIATTAEIARDVYGVKPEKRHMEAVNDAMYTLGYLVVQQLTYQRHEKGKRGLQAQSYPARRFLSWDRLHQNGRNVTYDIQLGEPILAVLEDFARQVAGIPEGALALDARQPAHSRFATAIIMRCNLTWETRKWARNGLNHREILEYAGYDPDAIDPRQRPKYRKMIAGLLEQPQLWEHRYATGTNMGITGMRWEQWLEGPRVLITVHKHERTEALDNDETAEPAPESSPQMHPSWGG